MDENDYLTMTAMMLFECIRRYKARGHLTLEEKEQVLKYIQACLVRFVALQKT
jgi:hypothetical protein